MKSEVEQCTEEDFDGMLERGEVASDAEWGWYKDDVPRLIAELRMWKELAGGSPSHGEGNVWSENRAMRGEHR